MIRKQVYIWFQWVFKQGRRISKAILRNRLFTLLCWGVFFLSIYQLGSLVIADYINRQALKEARAIYEQQEVYAHSVVAEQEEEPPLHSHDEEVPENAQVQRPFKLLQQINPDIVGWLKIEDTLINYPVLQATDNEYYLHRNYRREENRAGSIFMDYRNDIFSAEQHTILYGHTMRDGSMFGQLKKYLEENYFQNHRQFEYVTLDKSYIVEIFSVYRTTIDFYYIQTEFTNKDQFGSFLQEIQNRSIYETGIEVSVEDQIITLSTCDYVLDPQDSRLVIHGKLISN